MAEEKKDKQPTEADRINEKAATLVAAAKYVKAQKQHHENMREYLVSKSPVAKAGMKYLEGRLAKEAEATADKHGSNKLLQQILQMAQPQQQQKLGVLGQLRQSLGRGLAHSIGMKPREKVDQQGQMLERLLKASQVAKNIQGMQKQPEISKREEIALKHRNALELKGINNKETEDLMLVDKYGNVTKQGAYKKGTIFRTKKEDIFEGLTPDQSAQASAMVKKYSHRSTAEALTAKIAEGLRNGKTLDEMEDTLRFAKQSPEFEPYRNAIQSISVDDPISKRDAKFDALDDYAEAGDHDGAKEYMKRSARAAAGKKQAADVRGMETTLSMFDVIEKDLQLMEDSGYGTGYWSGNADKLLAKVGQIKNVAHMEAGTRIALALIEYRKAMTGVQFGMKELGEYKRIFPDINKTHKLNIANLTALKDVFSFKTKRFYEMSMGKNNYDKIFTDVQVGDEDLLREFEALMGGQQ